MHYLTDHDKDIGEYDSDREDARRFDDDGEEIEPESPCEHCGRCGECPCWEF